MRVVVLERPAARPHSRAAASAQSPFTSSTWSGTSQSRPAFAAALALIAAGFQHRVRGQRGVPDRRDAGLAIGLVVLDHQQLVDRPPRDGAVGMVVRIAERVVHHHAVGHRRIDRAEPVFAVQPLLDEVDRGLDRALARRLRKQRLGRAQHNIDAAEEQEPRPFLVTGLLHRRRPIAAAPETVRRW